MDDKNKLENPLRGSPDEALFREVACRLRHRFYVEHGKPFLFGSFEFVFHGGKFQWIEESSRTRRYFGGARKPPMVLTTTTNQMDSKE